MIRSLGAWLIFAILVFAVPASANTVEFSESHHTGEFQVDGALAAAAFYNEEGPLQTAGIQVSTGDLTLRYTTVDYFVETEGAGAFSSAPEHHEKRLTNVTLQASPNADTLYLDVHALSQARITYSNSIATSAANTDETHSDLNRIATAEPRTSDITETTEITSSRPADATITGGVSVNLWGWTVRIVSDEGVFEYETGPSRDNEAGPASVGSAMQMQVESDNATVEISGTFNDVHKVWIRDAVAESDRLDLKLTDEDLPIDQGIFTDRSRMTVLAVTGESVVADVQEVLPEPVPEPPVHEPSPDPSDETTATEPLLGPDGGGSPAPLTTVATDGPNVPGWIAAAIITAILAAVFFAVRQTRGWPTHAFFIRRAESLHDAGQYRLVAWLSTLGHWLQPQDARHRFHRGLARSERRDREGAFADLMWASVHLSNHEEQAVSAYYAACMAARTGRTGAAGDLLARAARVDEQFLWDAQEDPGLDFLSGKPDFEAGLAKGML